MLYIVHLLVQRARADEWQAWMVDHHVQDVLDTGFFEQGLITRVPDLDTDNALAYRALYQAKSAADFEAYQREDGPRLRDDHVSRFGDDVEGRRELLPILTAVHA